MKKLILIATNPKNHGYPGVKEIVIGLNGDETCLALKCQNEGELPSLDEHGYAGVITKMLAQQENPPDWLIDTMKKAGIQHCIGEKCILIQDSDCWKRLATAIVQQF